MLYYDRIDVSEGSDPAKPNNDKECMVCLYWFFNHGLNIKILSAVVVMIYQCCQLTLVILLLSLLKVLIIVVLLMILANLK